MIENRHVPVLPREILEAFERAPAGTIVDGTLGGGGHTRALLERYPKLRVLACDRDPAAIAATRENSAGFISSGRLGLFEGDFARAVDEGASFPPGFAPPWSGALLDLGYSSNQLEDAAYGMSFTVEGPLDMRLSREGQTAWELLCDSTAEELADILATYGEIPGARGVARRLKRALDEGEVTDSTTSLAGFLKRTAPPARSRDAIHPATLVFQALRIAVNDELRALDHFLNGVIIHLNPAAVVAVIAFHSLEDRLVKQWGRGHTEALEAVTRKPITPATDELATNPRSRSAKLRVFRKL